MQFFRNIFRSHVLQIEVLKSLILFRSTLLNHFLFQAIPIAHLRQLRHTFPDVLTNPVIVLHQLLGILEYLCPIILFLRLTIRAIIRYAVRKDIMSRVTSGLLKVKQQIPAKRTLTAAERELIVKADFNSFERCFVYLLLYTGLRKSEALALDISDIDLDHKKINVCKTLITSRKVEECLQDYTKTKAGKRQVPIPAPLLPFLKDYMTGRTGILFPSRTGGYIGNGSMCNHWSNVLKKFQAVSKAPLAEDISAYLQTYICQ